jgi:hypothetical protein
MRRRDFLSACGAALFGAATANAQQRARHEALRLPEAASSPEPFAALRGGIPHHLTPEEEMQRVVSSPAAPGPPGRWVPSCPSAHPPQRNGLGDCVGRSPARRGRIREGRVDRAYHHIYDPALDRWFSGAPLPRGANHVAVTADAGRVYALGGFIEQNRNPDHNAYAYEVAEDRWNAIAPLPRARGAAAAVVLDRRIHLIGGASEPTLERASVGWHEVYDPQADTWTVLKALPGARDHVGCAAFNGRIHVIGGRFNTFEYNTGLHHVYLPDRDTWEERAPLPTVRSGHGPVVYRDRLFAMGGEAGIRPDHSRPRFRANGELRSRTRNLDKPCSDADTAARRRSGCNW